MSLESPNDHGMSEQTTMEGSPTPPESLTEGASCETSTPCSETSCDSTPTAPVVDSPVIEPVCDTPKPEEEGITLAAEPERPRLNPTVTPEMARPIPNISSPVPMEENEGRSAESYPMQAYRSEPVAIPRTEEIDAETQAEIEAAMASGELPTIPVAAEESPPEPGAPPAKAPRVLTEETLRPGQKLKGVVASVGDENVILDLKMRSSGCIPGRQFEGKFPAVGETIDVAVDRYDAEEGLIHCSLPKAVHRPSGNWDQVQVGQVVECLVSKTNKGGLEVTVSGLRGFLPAGQVDVGFVSNLDQFVGQKLKVKVSEVNPQKRNLVVSRRQYLEIARGEAREEIWKKLEISQIYPGVVKTIKEYGAFIDIGGVDGLLHVGEMSWNRIGHPSEILKEGQQVQVQIIAIDREKSKISLGMKQLNKNPWGEMATKFPPNAIVQGKVTKTTDFGAFVELEPGVEGLIHISELDHRRVARVTDVVRQGQEIRAQVLNVDLDRRRIALSMKALIAKPEAPRRSDVDMAPGGDNPYERKRKGPLRGGTAGKGGNYMFGGHDRDE